MPERRIGPKTLEEWWVDKMLGEYFMAAHGDWIRFLESGKPIRLDKGRRPPDLPVEVVAEFARAFGINVTVYRAKGGTR